MADLMKPRPIEMAPEPGPWRRDPDGIRRRRSPLGVPEVMVEPGMPDYDPMRRRDWSAFTTPSSSPTIYYRQDFADRPSTALHERIHAAQEMLPRKLNAGQTKAVFGRLTKNVAKPVEETPAYHLTPGTRRSGDSDYRYEPAELPYTQRMVSDYLDALNVENSGGAEVMEATLPDQFVREYVRSSPPMGGSLPKPRVLGMVDPVPYFGKPKPLK